MKIEHLEERIRDYQNSIDQVIEKRILWNKKTRPLLLRTLKKIVDTYDIGWKVQDLDWIKSTDAINIGFDSFPSELIHKIQNIKHFNFVPGGALIFSESYNGDVIIFILFQDIDSLSPPENIMELGSFSPEIITENFIINKVDEFLKEMINWEIPENKKLGFVSRV